MSALVSLRHLWAPRNQIERLPSSLAQLGGSLETLQVHENKIRALPKNIAGLAGKLRVLNLRKNQLRSELTGDDGGGSGVPASLRMLTALERLAIDGNGQLNELPDAGRVLTCLTRLAALSLDTLAFHATDAAVQRWVHENVPELAVPQSRLPKSRMKEHLFGDAAKPQSNGIKL